MGVRGVGQWLTSEFEIELPTLGHLEMPVCALP